MSLSTGSFYRGPSHLKQQLMASFDPFTGHTASPTSIKLARDLLNSGESRHERYQLLNFDLYLERNQHTPSYLTMMTSAYDQLLKYISNLLRPKRPQVWRSIKTNNTAFKARVTCMEGAEDILKQAGYSEVRSDSLCFPDDVTEPDKGMLAILASEILMAKLEVEQMNSNPQPRGSPGQRIQQPQYPVSRGVASPYEAAHTERYPSVPQTKPFDVRSDVMEHFNNKPPAPSPQTRQPPVQQRPQDIPPHTPPIARTDSSSSDPPVPKKRTKFLKLVQPEPVVDTPVPAISEDPTPTSSLNSNKSSSGEIKSPMVGSDASDSPKNTNDVIKNAASFLEQMKALKKQHDAKLKNKPASGPLSDPPSPTPAQRPSSGRPANNSGGVRIPPQVDTIPEQGMMTVEDLEENLYTEDPVPPPNVQKRPSQEYVSATAPVGVILYCTECRTELTLNCKFCNQCGTKVVPLRAADPEPQQNLPPKPAPRTPTDPKKPPTIPPSAWEQPETPPAIVPRQAKPEPKQQAQVPPHQARSYPPVDDTTVSDPPPLPPKGPNITPQVPDRRVVNPQPQPEPVGAESSTGLEMSPEDFEIFCESPGIKLLIKKEQAYKESQRRKGVPEGQLKPLGELEDKKQRYLSSKPKPGAKKVDREKFPSKNTSHSNYPLCDPAESKRIRRVATEGRALLDNIKSCVPQGYTLEEVQVANSQDSNGLGYLRTQWNTITIQAQRNLSLYHTEEGYRVGTPGDKEMRDALARAGGDTRTAEKQVFQDRDKKIRELLSRVGKIRTRNREIPPLSWEGAVTVLSANNMDVDTAFYVLQCDWLKPLYDYIFDESNNQVLLPKVEMVEIKKVIQNKDIDKEAHLRLLMAECKFSKKEDANIVIELLQEMEVPGSDIQSIDLQYYVDAAKDHGSLERARNFLFRECQICVETYTIHDFVAMPGCVHSICKTCFKDNFSLVIKNQEVKHFVCPVCGEPDMANNDITEGFYLQIFVGMIKEHLDQADYELCVTKLNEFSLLKDPNFIWCANSECRSGFIHEGRADDVACPNCRKSMCRKCKKPWEPTHEGLNCEQFAQWKRDNDPDAQEQGLAAHLQANGIECPGCHFKYDLAKGGCMHFKCVRCPNEFCSGCGESFKNGQACGKLDSCKSKGLHAHHPRDCLFFMRDFDVGELQNFLKDNNIEYDTKAKDVAPAPAPDGEAAEPAAEPQGEPPQPQGEVPAEEAAEKPKEKGCIVMLQKETMEGLLDEECGKPVVEGQAGLCTTHYKEYLVDLINRNNLDPVKMYETHKIEVMLRREELELPEKDDEDDDDTYREKLVESVKEKLPLLKGGVQAPAAPNPPPAIDADLPQQPPPEAAP